MQSPRPGDRFTEMYSFWLYILEVNGDEITYMEASAPCTLPKDGTVRTSSLDEFRERFSYQGIDGYWITFVDHDNNVAGWKDAGRQQ